MSDTAISAGRFVGQAVTRKEDPRLLTGRGRYTDDVVLPNMLHAHFVRSDLARAKITHLDVSAAREAEGVVAVFTADDLNDKVAVSMLPSMFQGADDFMAPIFPLAKDDVRFVGDPIVLIVARNRYLAEDAAELIEIDFDPLPPVVDWFTAAADMENKVHENRMANVCMVMGVPMSDEAKAECEAAAHVIEASFIQHRYSAVPMECRAIVADYNPFDRFLDVHVASQNPHEVRCVLARVTGLPENNIRVRIGDVGGGFGLKSFLGREEQVIALAAYLTNSTIKWSEDRRENLIASAHARQELVKAKMYVDGNHKILGIDVDHLDDSGAYPIGGGSAGPLVGPLMTGPYKIDRLGWNATQVWTNTCGSAAYRGPWMMETTAREELMDFAARELGIDPLEFRRINVLQDADLPYDNPGGQHIENVSPSLAQEKAAEAIGYDEFRKEQAKAREEGRYLGIGMAGYVEPQPNVMVYGNEPCHVRMHPDGRVDAFIGSGAHGQGLETTTAQLVAENLGVHIDDVTVHQGDTESAPFGPGTGGSRSGPMIGAAVTEASIMLKEKVLAIAAHLLEAAPEDLEAAEGVVSVKGTPAKSITMKQVADTVYGGRAPLPHELDRTLEVMHRYDAPPTMWSNAATCTVEVDIDTGLVKFLRYVVAEDCGKMINPNIVDGQVHGGVAQGIGGCLYEENVYDADGNPLASTFLDYLLPTAHEIPEIETVHIETPASTVGGFKGVGEGGAIAAPAAVFNAVADALAPLGVKLFDQPLSPDKIVAAVKAATGK